MAFSSGKTLIIGRDEDVKTDILKAIEAVLCDTGALHGGEPSGIPNAKSGQTFIWAELSRGKDEALDYDLMYKCRGFHVYSRQSPRKTGDIEESIKVPIRIPSEILPKNLESVFNITEEDNAAKLYVNPMLRHESSYENQFDDKYSFAVAASVRKDRAGALHKDSRLLYREDQARDWVMAFRSDIKACLLNVKVARTINELKKTGRMAGLELPGRNEHGLFGDEMRRPEAVVVSEGVIEDVKSKAAKRGLRVEIPGTAVVFNFHDNIKFNLFNDIAYQSQSAAPAQDRQKTKPDAEASGDEIDIERGGSGAPGLLCIAAPETGLHPHAQRALNRRLDRFLMMMSNKRNQVALTTNSPEFIGRYGYDCGVAVIRRSGHETTASFADMKEHLRMFFNNGQKEMLFSDKLIVCKGLEDHVLKIAADELYPGMLDENNISMVSAGTTSGISGFTELALRLGIRKCFVFADLGYPAQPQDALASKPPRKRNMKTIGPFWKYPSGIGVYIMGRGIEELIKDKSLLSQEKSLTLDTICKIRSELIKGRPIADMIGINEIREFLQAVMDS